MIQPRRRSQGSPCPTPVAPRTYGGRASHETVPSFTPTVLPPLVAFVVAGLLRPLYSNEPFEVGLTAWQAVVLWPIGLLVVGVPVLVLLSVRTALLLRLGQVGIGLLGVMSMVAVAHSDDAQAGFWLSALPCSAPCSAQDSAQRMAGCAVADASADRRRLCARRRSARPNALAWQPRASLARPRCTVQPSLPALRASQAAELQRSRSK
jgi:hypothetical protein